MQAQTISYIEIDSVPAWTQEHHYFIPILYIRTNYTLKYQVL